MNRRLTRTLVASALGIALFVAAEPAAAGGSGNQPELTLDGRSSYSINGDAIVLSAAATVWFKNERVGLPVVPEARLVVDDGSLPDPDTGEPASAQFSVTGDRRSALELGGTGSICGQWTDQTSIVTHLFTGRYDVADASRKKLVGTDGFFQFGLTNQGSAFAFAVHT